MTTAPTAPATQPTTKPMIKPAKPRLMTDENLGRHLSYVLRHRPGSIGLAVSETGWASIDDLIARARIPLTRSAIERVVAENDKRRFAISADGLRICANQGHTIKVRLDLREAIPPARLYHGTAARFLPQIFASGLSPMRRHHVHLSTDVAAALAVGARHGAPVALALPAAAMRAEGARFFLSANDVWLADAVAPRWLERVR